MHSAGPSSDAPDRRTLEWVIVAGLVLPLGTVGAVRWGSLALDLPPIVWIAVLFLGPLGGAFALVGSGSLGAGPLARVPGGRPRRFRDRIPERYHEEFAVETLNETVEPERTAWPRRRLALLYCAMVPVVTLLVLIL